MNKSQTLGCAICLLGQTTGLSQVSQRTIPSSPVFPHWTVFSNPRFGYELPVPPGVRALSVPAKGTETKFVSQDGDFEITAFGGVSPDSPVRVMETAWNQARSLPGRSFNYCRKAPSWFVVSGADRSGTEFYQKYLFRGDQVATFTLTYPHSRLHDFDAWVSGIEDRFRIFYDLAYGPPETAPASPDIRMKAPNPSAGPKEGVSNNQPIRRPDAASLPNPRWQIDLSPPQKNTKRQPDLARADEGAKPGPLEKTRLEMSPTTVKPTQEDLPYGIPVAGKPGFAYSPYGSKKMVDVVDLSRGTKVKCPYTARIFRVP